jgi:hypothetical protein
MHEQLSWAEHCRAVHVLLFEASKQASAWVAAPEDQLSSQSWLCFALHS